MFRGISKASLDDRGRFAVPARFRDSLRSSSAGKLVITIDRQEKCLLLYPDSEWEAVEKRLEQLSNLRPAVRQLQRMLVGFATDVELDNNGRVLIPPILRDYAEIDRSVMVMGQPNKLELWSEDVLNAEMPQWRSQGNEAFESLKELGDVQLADIRL
ncbi:MAG: division/cell wall cluster transcriptional repressor MraZ [Gammaproteobacteria bacterium]|nr:division/cell wall cluster transcriptional repressor MraZ [Gammaproteobacteria bacterium]MDE0444906.1 division/cell wall cluster transcriptional repressor MraZ [Gammaproteobacteria bacterium]